MGRSIFSKKAVPLCSFRTWRLNILVSFSLLWHLLCPDHIPKETTEDRGCPECKSKVYFLLQIYKPQQGNSSQHTHSWLWSWEELPLFFVRLALKGTDHIIHSPQPPSLSSVSISSFFPSLSCYPYLSFVQQLCQEFYKLSAGLRCFMAN